MSIHLQKSVTIQKKRLPEGAFHTDPSSGPHTEYGLQTPAFGASALSSTSLRSSPSSAFSLLNPQPLMPSVLSLGGLHVFKPSGPALTLPAPLAKGSVRTGPLRIKNSAYEKAISHITAFAAWFKNHISPQGKAPRMAWLCERHAPCAPYPPALQSRGLPLENILFLESESLLQSTQQLCEDDFFDTLILQGQTQPVLLKIAHRWLAAHRVLVSSPQTSQTQTSQTQALQTPHLRSVAPFPTVSAPLGHTGCGFPQVLGMKKADELEGALHTRLFLFLE